MYTRLYRPGTDDVMLLKDTVADDAKGHYDARVVWARLADTTWALLLDFERLVNDQIFSLTDEAADRIDALGFVVVGLPGGERLCHELQVFEGRKVSFRIS